MTKRDVQRAHDFLDAFEAEIVERSRRELGAAVAGLPFSAVLAASAPAMQVVCARCPDAVRYNELMARILIHLAPFIDRRVWTGGAETERLVMAIYRAAKECTL